MNKILLVLIGFVVFCGVYLIGVQNNLVTLSQSVDQQWAQVETQYQRRFDLIPNLVSSSQAVLTQEKSVFQAIADARTQYGNAKTTDDRVQAAGTLDSSLSRLLVIMENYPQLKSDQTIARLMDELSGTENRIAVERSRYNEIVTSYNTKIKIFPTSIAANLLGYKERSLFKSQDGASVVPKVEFNK